MFDEIGGGGPAGSPAMSGGGGKFIPTGKALGGSIGGGKCGVCCCC